MFDFSRRLRAHAPAPSLGRRELLRAGAALPLLCLSGSPLLPRPFEATFFQIWAGHLELSRDAWDARLVAIQQLGCRELILQWIRLDKVSGAWEMPASLLEWLLDRAAQLGMGVRIGLPYDGRWWEALGVDDDAALAGFLMETQLSSTQYMRDMPWASHAAFRGWYVPYEIEQYSWRTPARCGLLLSWLGVLASASTASTPHTLAISTYFSQLKTEMRLESLWASILDKVNLRVMIQDGVGVAGMENYARIEPLCRLLRQTQRPFDMVVELFRETSPPNSPFQAVSAPYPGVRTQLEQARTAGAARSVAFAADPWLIDVTPAAKLLLGAWRAAYGLPHTAPR